MFVRTVRRNQRYSGHLRYSGEAGRVPDGRDAMMGRGQHPVRGQERRKCSLGSQFQRGLYGCERLSWPAYPHQLWGGSEATDSSLIGARVGM